MGFLDSIGKVFSKVPIIGDAVSGIFDYQAGKKERQHAEHLQNQQVAWQREFAKHGIRWRVEDAKSAGLHPAAGLSGGLPSYSPVYVDGGDHSNLTRTGQNISKSIRRMAKTSVEKDAIKIELDILKKRDEKLGLENDLLKQAILENENSAELDDYYGDAYGLPGQGKGVRKGRMPAEERVFLKAPEQLKSRVMGVSEGLHPLEQHAISKEGWLTFTLTPELAEMMEDNLDFKLRYYSTKLSNYYKGFRAAFSGPRGAYGKKWMRFWNKVLPPAKKGFYWQYHTARGQFKLTPLSERARRTSRMRQRPDWAGLEF